MDISHLATRDETKAEFAALRADIAGMRGELRVEIGDARYDLLKWVITIVISALVINIGATASLIKLLVPIH